MSRKAVTEAGAVVLMLGVLASPARAQPIELADAQMDNITAGAFTVTTDPTTGAITLGGSHNGAPVTLTSTDGGRNFTSTTGSWATQVLYISTNQGFAVGILANGNQYWDGESPLPPTYILTPDRVIIACCGKQQSAPQQSAPQQSAPQQSAPQQSAPQQSAPQQSAPSTTAVSAAKKGAGEVAAGQTSQATAFAFDIQSAPQQSGPSTTAVSAAKKGAGEVAAGQATQAQQQKQAAPPVLHAVLPASPPVVPPVIAAPLN